jgi:predicted  nucleic acid-binding Zn-ribbon protein
MRLARIQKALGTVIAGLGIAAAAAAAPIPAGDELHVNTYTTGNQDFPAVAGTPDGGFVVVWESAGADGSADGIALQRYDSGGGAVGGELQVNTHTTGNQQDPAVAVGSDGTFVVVWDGAAQDGDQRGIFGQRFDSAGNPAGDEFQVNAMGTGDQNDAVVAKFSDGGFVVVWEDEQAATGTFENIVARRFDSDGDPAGAEIDVNVYISNDQEDAAVATDAADNFVVAWESEGQDGHYDSVIVRRYDSSAMPLSDEMVVNTYTLGDQDDPTLAVHPDGSFVIAWEDDTQADPLERTFARFFDSSGSPLTGEVEVSAVSDQVNPWAAAGGDGTTAIVWDSDGPDGDGMGIFGRAFDAAGSALGDAFQVNVTTAGPQGYPVIGAGGGQFLVVWEDPVTEGAGVGVYGRRLADAIFSDGFEGGDVSSWSSASP